MFSLYSLIRKTWEELLTRYKSGRVILYNEKNLEYSFIDICRELMKQKEVDLPVARQENHLGKRVDVRLGSYFKPILIQLKLYHDKADWKETRSMRNTVESDLKFAKGHKNVYVGIIDVIPTSNRPLLSFKLIWQTIEIDETVFQRLYANISPQTSPPRERVQKVLLANGREI